MNPETEDAGSVEVVNDNIVYTMLGVSETICPKDLAIVGELTTESFPFESSFLILIRFDGTWVEVPGGAAGIQQVLAWLRTRLHGEFDFDFLSDRFASRIFWPDELSGRELFSFHKVPRAMWHRIFYWYMPALLEHRLLPNVLEYLAEHSR